MSILDYIKGLTFRQYIWGLPIAFVLHEIEEINILPWHQQYWTNPPDITNVTVWTWLAFISLVGFIWTFLSLLPKNPKVSAFIIFPFFILTVFGNVLQHMYLFLITLNYIPGTITALILLLPVILYIVIRSIRDKIAKLWYIILLFVFSIPQLVSIVKAGTTMPNSLLSLYEFSEKLALLLFGKV